jgi:hypothetical protein
MKLDFSTQHSKDCGAEKKNRKGETMKKPKII